MSQRPRGLGRKFISGGQKSVEARENKGQSRKQKGALEKIF